MDIGTAKPSREERAAVPHYMLDVVAPDEQYSSQRFREEALRILHRIAARGRIALAVGGTGFYLRSLLDGLDAPQVPPRPQFRSQLREEAERLGPVELHRRLARVDPASAQRIHPQNLPRVIRALEIVDALGGPVPASKTRDRIPALYLGLTMQREALWRAIDRRAIEQVRSGLVEETRLLLSMGYGDADPVRGLGYRQMKEYLQGSLSLQDAIRGYQIATHQYARRQMTWFRPDNRIHWLEPGGQIGVAAELVERWIATA
jgi:tRNA dimethylallyltransferase